MRYMKIHLILTINWGLKNMLNPLKTMIFAIVNVYHLSNSNLDGFHRSIVVGHEFHFMTGSNKWMSLSYLN